MHTLHSSTPRIELRNYVRAFAQRSLESAGVDIVQAIPAYLEQVLEFEFGSCPTIEFDDGRAEIAHPVSAVGLIGGRLADIVLRGDVESFAIFFQPLAFWRLFGVPTSELANRFYDAQGLLGIEIHQLWERLANTATFGRRVHCAEQYLMKRMGAAIEHDRITSAADYIFQCEGRIRVDELANRFSLSVRQLERRFMEEIGISPKLFARIARFQTVLDARLSRQSSTWTNLAHEYGFSDQMHMIKDFHGLSGFSPDLLIDSFGDLRPAALAKCRQSELPVVDYSKLNDALNFRTGCGVKTSRH